MANHKSAKTRINRNHKRSIINGARRSRVRTFVKKVIAAILAGDKETATVAFKVAVPFSFSEGAGVTVTANSEIAISSVIV